MFDADYTDVTLKKIRKFGDIGETDTLRIYEPSSSFIDKPYKDESSRLQIIREQIRINTFAVINGAVHELPKKINLYDCINILERNDLEKEFLKFIGLGVDEKLDEEGESERPK